MTSITSSGDTTYGNLRQILWDHHIVNPELDPLSDKIMEDIVKPISEKVKELEQRIQAAMDKNT